MVLLEDTRQQPGKHKNVEAYCRQAGIEIIRTKLLTGDYMLSGAEFGGIKGDVAADSKMGVGELASCVFQDHERFRDELIRAQRCGIRLYILTEEVLPGDGWKTGGPPWAGTGDQDTGSIP